MGTKMKWNDESRTLTMQLEPGSRMLPPLLRKLEIRLQEKFQTVEFDGGPVEVKF